MNSNLFQREWDVLCTWLVCRGGLFIRHHGLSWWRRVSPSEKGAWSHWDKHSSPDLHGPFFFSQFISSWITRLSHTSEEGEDHTRASVTLCFTNEACTLRLLAFALLPFETAAAWCYNTLVFFFLRYGAPGCYPVCVSLGSVCPVSVTIHVLTRAQRDTPRQI